VQVERKILATDLDGTFIPIDESLDQWLALEHLRRLSAAGELDLVYVTGRHPESVLKVMNKWDLPPPHWIICDVGTTLLKKQDDDYVRVDAYTQYILTAVGGCQAESLQQVVVPSEDLVFQEAEKQGLFKLSYYCDASRIGLHQSQIQQKLAQADLPYQVISSVDPFNGDGLIDLLPIGIHKAGALRWWVQQQRHNWEDLVYAGDSGNDFAALTSGLRAIVVGNADRSLAERVAEFHRQSGTSRRLYLARNFATAGVWEGCRWFGLL
jgi:maltooligosyltrehalose trehalohydrolase